MGPGADEVQPVHVFTDVVRTKPGALRQYRLETEPRPAVGEQPTAKIQRCHQARADHVRAEPGQHGVLQALLNRGPKRLGLGFPVRARSEMGHRRQGIKGVASGGRQARVQTARSMQVETEILGQAMAAEDIVEQPAIAGAEQHRVLRQRLVAAVGAEIPDEQTRRKARALNFSIAPMAAMPRFEQMPIGPRGVRVGHDNIRAQDLTGGQTQPTHPALLHKDLLNLGIAAQGDALGFHQADHGLNQGARATHGGVHAVMLFQVRDQRVNGGHRVGIAADQQRVKTQHGAQARVLDVAGHQRMQTAQPLHAQHFGDHLEHIAQPGEGHFAELLITQAISQGAALKKFLIALNVTRRQARHLGAHKLRVARVIEGLAIVEAQAKERLHGAQIDIVGKAPAAQRPQLFEEEGGGDNGRTGIEGEPVLAEHVGAPARGVEFFDNGNPIPLHRQANRGGQTAQSTADDQRRGRLIGAGIQDGLDGAAHHTVHYGLHRTC